MSPPRRFAVAALAAFTVVAGGAVSVRAQEPRSAGGAAATDDAATATRADPTERPRARVPRLDRAEVRVDGRLDEPAWERAAVIRDLYTVEPVEGLPADPPWEVRILRTDTHLYLGFVMYEPHPGSMVLQNLRRDAFLRDDDRVEIVLDTFRDARTAYFFQLSAAGSRGDALISDNGRRFQKSWNGWWKGRTWIGPDRWTAEFEIPFATLAFTDADAWGANFQRFRGADRSQSRWAAPERRFSFFNVRESGVLTGMAGAHQAQGFELRPYAKLDGLWGSDDGADGFELDGGGEFSWRITPQMTASVTLNTDFAETEVDDRQINLTRFPLFFPEKRDFFLQDSSLFQFGEQGEGFGRGGNDLLPYFSRRIGLANDVEVPLDYGLRVAGRAGRWDLGFLGVRADSVPDAGVPASTLVVARPSYRVNEDLALGGLFTSGNPEATTDNRVAGADLRWNTTELLPGNFSLNAFVSVSDDEGQDAQGVGFGLEAFLRTRDWILNYRTVGTQDEYLPALGFVRRPGQWRHSAVVEWQPRPESGPVRKYTFSVQPTVWTDLGGDLVSSSVRFEFVEIEWNSGDRLGFDVFAESDRPDTDFDVADVTIPAGDYSWWQPRVRYRGSNARPVSASATLRGGPWYDGDLLSFRAGLRWNLSARVATSLSYQEDRGSLPAGDFTTRLEQLRFDWDFTPDLSWRNLVQADNLSDTLGLQSRLRWILEDGRELFVVVESGWSELPGGAIAPETTNLAVKLVWAVRF